MTSKIADMAEEVNDIFDNSQKDKERQDANAELIQILAQYLVDHPETRFSQALRNLNMVAVSSTSQGPLVEWQNEFYLEPVDLLKRVKQP